MHISHICAELAPVAKVGGLADVVLGLSRELSWKNHHVEIILPKYDCLDLQNVDSFEVYMHDLWSYYRGQWHHNTVWKGLVHGLKVYFIESHDSQHYFNRGCIYGAIDDIDRFTYFCRASLEFILKRNETPEIIHIHDWPTSLVALLYRDMYKGLGLNGCKIVLTIHNLEHQGLCRAHNLNDVGLIGQYYEDPSLLLDNLNPQDLNLLKGGIVYSDFVTTVSPNYAIEALTPIGGKGLESTLASHSNKFCGILNGIDYSYWNPEIDPHLPHHYSKENLSDRMCSPPFIPQKEKLQKHLRHSLSLNNKSSPIVCCITRLVSQKGPELIRQALFRTLEKEGQFILLGSCANKRTQEEFLELKTELANNRQVHIELSFNEHLSHLVYAGSDMIIIPSIFEPCGLTQMIAMKYGTIPIVRKTGGLADTVFDADDASYAQSEGNGYTFVEATQEGVYSALDRAINSWHNDPQKWRQLISNAMGYNFSWNKPAENYLEIYNRLSTPVDSKPDSI